MTYKLVKKLKDSGWPQLPEENGSYYALPIGCTYLKPTWYEELLQKEVPAKIPTLSELIEACGEDFVSLEKRASCWEAEAKYMCCESHGKGRKFADGNTPEEAVANLWLKSHDPHK